MESNQNKTSTRTRNLRNPVSDMTRIKAEQSRADEKKKYKIAFGVVFLVWLYLLIKAFS